MTENSPSLEEWKPLYEAAIEFQKIKSWKWMYDSDIFGVQNPQNGEIGYCCVMGNLGEVFGIAVYLGSSGLEGYKKMQSGQIQMGDPDLMHIQNCLMASYDDKNHLEKEDLQVINQLGLKFKGRNAWPSFRNYKPGYYPWFLNRNEVLYLTQVLEQAKDVCLRFLDNKNLLHPPKNNLYLTRVPEKSATGLTWRDEWLKPAPLPKDRPFETVINEVQLKRIKKSAKSSDQVWEVDFFFAPSPIMEKERPYFPYVTCALEQRSGLMLGVKIMPLSEYQKGFQDNFLSFIEKAKIIPAKVLVRKEEALKLLEPFGSELNFKLGLAKVLPRVDEARAGMMEYFSLR